MNHETKRSRAAASGTQECPECKERFAPDYPGQIYCSAGRSDPDDWEEYGPASFRLSRLPETPL
jgi:hypothetical protein